jgi:hypothetical protein
MAEGFLGGLHRHLIFWSGWVFTVGGAVASLWIGKEYAWIGVLLFLAGLTALTAFAYQKHRDLQQAQQEHQARTSQWEADLRAARERAEQAERRLNEVPLDLVNRLQEMLASYTFEEAVRLLAEQAEFVARMQRFSQAVGRPLNLRIFIRQGGQLHAIAKAPSAALEHLRVGDRFRLLYRSASGLETMSAWVEVSQPVNLTQETAAFRFVRFLEEEMGHIDQLARSRDVRSMAGYSLVPDCDPGRYPDLDLSLIRQVLQRLALEIAQRRRG